ncbi:hypothetical protein PILCRDRAFT_804663 [Piloderma croceum F 1598]|uniref:Uncharacterized protein n=1 Tax=Piloderma croceum (strain F 1598) TaxID=765440 RepID=A0A0C3EVD6_PILCF|nr:hypothetical protein PILCRDRAFT_804663 [Piloderma croceum F 1598]
MLEMLIWHEDFEKAPKHIGDAIDGSSYEGSFGAPLDLLISMKKTFEDKTDKEKEKLQKRVRKTNSFNLQTFLEDKREQHEGFQEKMLSEIEKGIYLIISKILMKFRRDTIKILGYLVWSKAVKTVSLVPKMSNLLHIEMQASYVGRALANPALSILPTIKTLIITQSY